MTIGQSMPEFLGLAADDPTPFRVLEGRADCPFVLAADHAGQTIPRALGTLGLGAPDLERHIAWDIGIGGVTERLAALLGAFAITQTYSRLVIDCNRLPGTPASIVELSEHTAIPGNQGIGSVEAEARSQSIFLPYHRRIETEIARRESTGQETIFIAMHSFTPSFKGNDRPWHCGVLYHRDARLSDALLARLRVEPLVVGDNEPYFVSEDSDYGVLAYGERRGNLHVEFEIRQDLIATPTGQAEWAALLASALPDAVALARSNAARL
jgi:predicted N-formylglutamate amidohydrolase